MEIAIKTTQHRYVRNTIANLIGNGVIAAMMFVVTPLLIRLLGDTQYGLFRVALVSVVSYASILDLGLNNAVRRFFSDAIHHKNNEQANQVLGIAYSLYLAISAVAMVSTAVLLWWLPGWVQTPAELIWPFRGLLLGAAIYVSCQFLFCPLRSIFVAFSRYDLLQISMVLTRALLFAIAIGLLIFWQKSLTAMTIAAIGSSVIVLIITALMARNIYPAMSIKWNYKDRSLQKKIFSFGGYGLMIAIGPLIIYQTQDVLISGFMGPANVTTYAIAAILMTQMRALGAAFASPLFPIASKLKAQGDSQGVQNLLLAGTKRCLWIWVSVAGPLVIFAGDFITVWIGPQYRWVEVLVWILLIGNLGTTIGYAPIYVLTASGSIKWLGYTQVAMSVAAVGGMLFVLGLTSWGLLGLAWVISLLLVVRTGVLSPIYACMQLKMNIGRYFLKTLGPLLITLILAVGISYAVRSMFMPKTLIGTLVCIIILVFISGGMGGFLVLPANERKKFWAKFSKNRN